MKALKGAVVPPKPFGIQTCAMDPTDASNVVIDIFLNIFLIENVVTAMDF
jgi:hypothetical protein